MNGFFEASILSLGILLGTVPDPEAQVLKEADRLYEVARTGNDLLEIEALIREAAQGFPESERLSWRLGRTYFKLGERSASKEDKIRYYSLCLEHSRKNIQINPRSAVGFFFQGLCRGKLGQTRGLWSSLGMIYPFKKDMEQALRLDPAVNEGGPHRALGYLYLKLPFLLGGDLKRSIHHFREAVRLGPRYGENYLGLARAYFQNDEFLVAQKTLQTFFEVTRHSQGEDSSRSLATEARALRNQIAARIGSEPHAQRIKDQ